MRRVAQRVFDQVVQQHAELRGVAADEQRRAGTRAQVDAQVFGLDAHRSDHGTRQLGQIDRVVPRRFTVGLEARDMQQLFNDMLRALDAGLQFIQRLCPLRVVARAAHPVQLQAQRRHRRAQPVGCISEEAALRREGLRQPAHQPVDRRHQRRHLVGHIDKPDRRQRARAARGDVAAGDIQRTQRAAQCRDHQCRHQHHQRNHRQHDLQGRFAGGVDARRRALCGLRHAARADVGVDDPVLAFDADAREGFVAAERYRHARIRREHAPAVARPGDDDLGRVGDIAACR